jgi:hypothetical protein
LKSNSKEAELKKYVNVLNDKMMNNNIEYDETIDSAHKEILSMIEEIQEKIKVEIDFTKKELDKEVKTKFLEAEEKQKKLYDEKVHE